MKLFFHPLIDFSWDLSGGLLQTESEAASKNKYSTSKIWAVQSVEDCNYDFALLCGITRYAAMANIFLLLPHILKTDCFFKYFITKQNCYALCEMYSLLNASHSCTVLFFCLTSHWGEHQNTNVPELNVACIVLNGPLPARTKGDIPSRS